MPPANSPTDNPPEGDPFAELAAPVPNLAATLTTRAEDNAHTDNIEFLRSQLQELENPQSPSRSPDSNAVQTRNRILQNYSSRFMARSRRLAEDVENLERIASDAISTTRLPLVPTHGEQAQSPQPPQRQTQTDRNTISGYQGWAPGTTEHDLHEPPLLANELSSFAREYVRDNATRRHRREQELTRTVPSHVHPHARRQGHDGEVMDWRTMNSRAEVVDLRSSSPYAPSRSLRTEALLQSVRRQARFHIDGDHHPRENDRDSEAYRQYQANRLILQEQANRHARQAPMANNRSRRAEHYTPPETEAAKWLEEAIKHLERLRTCESHSDRISSAAAGGFFRSDFYNHNREDFILDTARISSPAPTSWLRPGGVFSGSQHTSGGIPVSPFHLSTTRRNPSSPGRIGSSSAQGPSIQPMQGSWINRVVSQGSTERSAECWPVKVAISSVDYESMTLTGTMEASNVPNKTSPAKEMSITTYLEGEIIDLNKHTLETKGFNAGSEIDTTYWRKLEPFKSLSDEEVVTNLVSIKWLTEELAQKWILMRWKEKCFVTPPDAAQSNLTISGFYYVSLCRADGRIEGLYFDPLSSPYQHLSLKPERREFPSYTFA